MSQGTKSSEFLISVSVIIGLFVLTYLEKQMSDNYMLVLTAILGGYGFERYKLKTQNGGVKNGNIKEKGNG